MGEIEDSGAHEYDVIPACITRAWAGAWARLGPMPGSRPTDAAAGRTFRSEPDPSPNAPGDQILRKDPCCDMRCLAEWPSHGDGFQDYSDTNEPARYEIRTFRTTLQHKQRSVSMFRITHHVALLQLAQLPHGLFPCLQRNAIFKGSKQTVTYELILKLDAALWLRIMFKPLLTPQSVIKIIKLTKQT